MRQKKLKMKKNNYKSGFTLAEVLCALAIVGICTAFAMTLMKPAQKSAMKYLYMNAYTSIEKAYYNSAAIGFDPFSTEPDEDGVPPVFSDTKDTGALKLCQGLTTYINTTTNVKTEDDDYSSSCSDTKITSELAKDDDFNNDTLQFTATNGMRFYISKQLTMASGDKFYLVFVDVNGERGPNSIDYSYKGGKTSDDYNDTDPDDVKQKAKDQIEPDIYAFAILKTGRICPIGIPEYDSNILTARFAYFDSDGNVLYTKHSLPYYQAKGAAWGYYNTAGPDLLAYNEDEPFTMNDAIRAAINSESKLVKNFPDLTSIEPMEISAESPYFCSNEDLESCYVFLDTYKQ